MRSLTHGGVRKTSIVVAALAMLLVVPATPASADSGAIEGVGYLVDECDGQSSLITIELTGSLEGCLYTTEITDYVILEDGTYEEYGFETVVACLNGEICGSFDTSYVFRATFSDTGEQLTGGCKHPILAGTGTDALAGATGIIEFRDNLVTGEVYYKGFVGLP